ncbi:CHAT domain-containing protein [Fusarium oxysporum II5]|nr:CHAT domain-containing protein [Fusarium oxysporum II5]
MDNVEYLSSADLLLYLQNVCEDQEDIPAHDKELDIATLVGDGTPQEIQYVIDLCKCIDEFEEEEQIKATDRLIAYLLNSPIIDDAEVLEQAIELSATLYRNQSVARDGNLLTHRENNYAKALGHRYWQQGIREDLDESIRLSEEAVAASPQAMFILSSPIGTIQQQPGLEVHALSTLAARLDELFQLTGSLESLNHSINIMERLVTAVHGPDWEDSRTEWLGNLAASIQRRYEQNEGDTSEDIDRAIQISREALQMMNGNDARRSLMLCTLANALGGRAFATDQTDNLDEAVRLLREAHDITPTKDARNIEVCYNLALRLFQRHAASDVKEAISIAESTLEYTHNNHPIRPHLQNLLGALYYQQYTKGVSKEGALKILEISWEALRNSHYPSVLYRLQAGRRILRLCCEMQNWLAAYEAAIATIELIPKLSMREIRNSDRQRLLSKDDVAGFSSDAAAAALNAGKSGFEVIRLLEMGRGSLASSVAELRTDLTSLQREYPNMAEQFIKLRDQLQISSPGQHHVSQGFDALLSVIRQKPGFEDFLMPPGDQKILDAAADGPIIMLNQSEYRSGVDAILIERDNIRIMNLRVSLQDMNMPLGRLQDNDFLERLWGSVAKPILEGLGIGLPSPGAPLPRIWWIPTGALSRLPFHAAGCHFASFADSVIDRAVSSYSSSIKALLETRARSSWLPQQSKDNAVLIGMSNTPGCSTLHYAIKEVQKIANLFATYGFTSTVLSNGRAQKQSILQLLKTCAMFHFAGHAMEDPLNPLHSALLLHDKEKDPMTVESLLEVNLSERSPFLAFLSACRTGSVTLSRFQDESIHLVAAYQLAGFRHVIGSLWPIEDQASMSVAEETYRNLLQGITEDRVSRSLHEATQKLRDNARLVNGVRNHTEPRDIISVDSTNNKLREEEGSWIPFVHFGI